MKLRHYYLAGLQELPFDLEKVCGCFVLIQVCAAYIADDNILTAFIWASGTCFVLVSMLALVRGRFRLRRPPKGER